jgi:DNA mismatch repair ATPase MutL
MNFSKLSGEFNAPLPTRRSILDDRNVKDIPIKLISASTPVEHQNALSSEVVKLRANDNTKKIPIPTTPVEPETRPTNFTKDDFLKLEIVGQFNQSFIICQLENRIFIVDQHAADERNTLEKLLKKPREKQVLIQPICLSGDVSDTCLNLSDVDILSLCNQGFVLTPDRSKLFCIPRELSDRAATTSIIKGMKVFF